MRDNWRRALLFVVLLLILAYGIVTSLPGVLAYGARGASDFSIFYTGASILRHGLAPRLYDLAVQAHFQSPFYRSHPLPFNHLAFELLLFLPFPSVTFPTAFWAWNAINLLLLAIFASLISPELQSLPKPVPLFIFIAGFAFFPVIAAFMGGQDSILLLLIYGISYRLLRKNKPLLAGFVIAAALIKFPLLLPFLFPFVFRRQWQFLGGFVIGSLAVLAVSIFMTGFSGFLSYIELLRVLASHPELGYTSLRNMPVARGFFETILPGLPTARTAFVAALSLVLLALSTLRFRAPSEETFGRWFALNIVTALVVCPHLYRHDWTVLLLALLLVWDSCLAAICPRTQYIILAVLTVTCFATPLYQLLNARDITSLMFIPLLFFCVTISLSTQPQAKTSPIQPSAG